MTSKYMPITTWGQGIDSEGRVIWDYSKASNPAGTLVSPYALGATNCWSPAFDPKRGLIFVNAARQWSYVTQSGFARLRHPTEYELDAIDYRAGNVVWRYELGDKGTSNLISGLLTTAGDLLFSGDSYGNFLALDPGTGKTLWHVGG